ncbi:MAG: Hsp33 family molecular chaperone HslO [Clostridia bacterium]|nr:Hsp33 family molecular chaperone HslO [Clostridia bacterium]
MSDKIAVALTDNAAMRIYAAVTTDIAAEAQRIHNTLPLATAALGRTLTAGALMGAMQKDENVSITIQFKGNGPLGTVLVVADSSSKVRGYVQNPHADLPLRADGKIDVGNGIGKNGYLSVIRDLGQGTQPYVGQVEITTGEIAEDLTYYYATSEQTPTAISLGVLVDRDYTVKAAGGYVIQMMPGWSPEDEQIISAIEKRLGEIPSVSTMVDKGYSPEDIIKEILVDIPYHILKEETPEYKCNCSKARVESALISIGKKDLNSLLEDNGTEVNCNFCDKIYKFTTQDIEELIKKCTK